MYWGRLTTFFIISLTIALVSVPILLGSIFMMGLLYAPCSRSYASPTDYGHQAESVILSARADGEFKGYFIPGSNGATIIMPPAFTSDRNNRLAEMDILARYGYAIFTFDSRPCAGMGPLSLGYQEVAEVADALDYLLTRPDVDPERIGIYGFSSAGATSVMSAARYPTLKAVVAEGGYGHFGNTIGDHVEGGLASYFIPLYRWGSWGTYRLISGHSVAELSPVTVINQIAPRPILLVYGSKEASLPGAYQQQAAAGDNATLWVVDGAGHGNYLQIAPEAYEARITAFFDESLLVDK